MNKRSSRIISLFLVMVMLLPTVVEAKSLSISAWGAIAIDADTGEVLYSKNANKSLVPASITKVMTTYIIYEEMAAGRLKKNSLIPVSNRVAKISRDKSYPMSVPLKAGGKYTVDQLIKLIMIPSASASCIAVAEHISGSEANFVRRMNSTAKKMGIQANFKNSHGARPHYTTARAMAILVKNFIDDYPDILNYTSLQGINFNGRRYNILNKLMHSKRYRGVDGFKTGTIREARYCLAATGKQNGRRVISVVLGSRSDNARYSDSRKILDLAFSKQKDKDKSRGKTKLEMMNLPEEIRRNTEYKPKIKFNNVSNSYSQNGKFYVDGKLVKSFKGLNIKNGYEAKIPFVYNNKDLSKDYIELKYEMEVPNKKPKIVVEKVKLSNRVPAFYKDLGNIDHDTEMKLKKLNKEGLMVGVGKGYFGGNNITNRGDFVTLLGRLVEYNGLEKIENKPSSYKDVKTNAYYNKYVMWATDNKLVRGYQNKFRPNSKISVEEAAVILDSFFKLYDLEIEESQEVGKIDRKNLSKWAKDSVERLSKTEFLYKEGSDTIYPKEKLKRIDLSNIIWKLWEGLEEDSINMEDINNDEYMDENYDQISIYKDVSHIDRKTESILKELKDKEIMVGRGNEYFGPKDITNRADFVTLLGRLVEHKGLEKIENKSSIYKDVKTSAYYNKYVVWASENNLVKGYQNKFMPRKNITIEEAALILDKFFDMYNIKLEDVKEKSNIDSNNLSSWAEESVIKLSKTNILYKFGSNKIYPKESVTRLDLAHIIWNVWDNLLNEEIEETDEDKKMDDIDEEILEKEDEIEKNDDFDKENLDDLKDKSEDLPIEEKDLEDKNKDELEEVQEEIDAEKDVSDR